MDFLSSFSAFGHDEAQNHYQNIYNVEQIQPHHQASFTHEAIAGAVGFAAMHAYESHLRATGQQPTHSLMKEILAGIAAAEVDKLVETKGMDWIDRHQAKKMAAHQAHQLAEQRYQGGGGWEYAQAKGGQAMEYNYGGGPPWGAQGHPAYGAYGGGYSQPQGGYYPPPQGYPPPAGYGPTPGQYYVEQPRYGGEGGYAEQPRYGEGEYREEHHHREKHHHDEHHHHHHHHHDDSD